jgi:hypothetical protein
MRCFDKMRGRQGEGIGYHILVACDERKKKARVPID